MNWERRVLTSLRGMRVVMGKTGEPKVWGLLEGLFGSGVWVGVAYEGEEVEEDEDDDWEMHCR